MPYMRMLRGVGNFRGGDFEGWFKKIYSNLGRERIRSRRVRRRRVVYRDLLEPASENEEGRIASQIDAKELMKSMKKDDREVVHYFHFLGMTHAEIAEKLGITETAPRSRLFDAHRRAREMYVMQERQEPAAHAC